MELKEAIIKRKSIRKYDMAEFSKDSISAVEQMIRKIKPLTSGGKFDFKIVGYDEFYKRTEGMFRTKAPHYIVMFGDGSDDAYKNIGYVGELAVLELTKKGLGTCWLGGAKSNEKFNESEYAISIAFGKPFENFREGIEEAKRKNVTEIATGYNKEQREILELARLAPSAMNFQPWYFRCEENKIHVFRKEQNGLLGAMIKQIKKIQKIDIGIVLAHFTIKPFKFEKIKPDIEGVSMNYEGTLCF